MRINLQFFGGRGASAGGGASAANALSQINSLKAPKTGQSVSVSYNGTTGTITRVKAGYKQASGSNSTMYAVNITRNGETVFKTNRYGSGAFANAKDDLKQQLGV